MPKLDNETLLLAFVIVTGAAVVLQALILLAIYVSLRKTAKAVEEQVENLRSAIMPVVDETREFYGHFRKFYLSFMDSYSKVAPKVEEAAADIAALTGSLRAQSADIQDSVTDVVARVRSQCAHIDDMFSKVLDGVDRAGGFVADMVSKPIRQIQAVLASVKAAIETLNQQEQPSAPPQPQEAANQTGDDIFDPEIDREGYI
jgi:ABC-type transporter Mla subunit MlaD